MGCVNIFDTRPTFFSFVGGNCLLPSDLWRMLLLWELVSAKSAESLKLGLVQQLAAREAAATPSNGFRVCSSGVAFAGAGTGRGLDALPLHSLLPGGAQ